jgi:inorganic pyrophosphatase
MPDLGRLPPLGASGALHVVVESPRGSRVKLKWDPELGAIGLSRPLPVGLVYPFDWGFIPGTRAQDGDPLDALVFWDVSSSPGVVLPCRAIGVVKLEQNRKGNGARVRNDRIIAVPTKHERGAALRSALDLPERLRDELVQFFLASIAMEPKDPKVLGWGGPEEANAIVRAAIAAVRGGRAGRARRAARAARTGPPRRR